jgi:hypothetical protein
VVKPLTAAVETPSICAFVSLGIAATGIAAMPAASIVLVALVKVVDIARLR